MARRSAASEPEPTDDAATQRRAALLDAAAAVIAEKGLEGVRTRDIVARAGVNISTLHYYFGTKEALLVAVVDHVLARFERAGATAGGDGVDRVLGHLRSSWQSFQDDPTLGTVLLELALRARRDPATRAAMRAAHRAWNSGLGRLIGDEIAAGRVRDDVDPAAAAYALTSTMIGAMVQLGVHARAFDYATMTAEVRRWLTPIRPPRRRAR